MALLAYALVILMTAPSGALGALAFQHGLASRTPNWIRVMKNLSVSGKSVQLGAESRGTTLFTLAITTLIKGSQLSLATRHAAYAGTTFADASLLYLSILPISSAIRTRHRALLGCAGPGLRRSRRPQLDLPLAAGTNLITNVYLLIREGLGPALSVTTTIRHAWMEVGRAEFRLALPRAVYGGQLWH